MWLIPVLQENLVLELLSLYISYVEYVIVPVKDVVFAWNSNPTVAFYQGRIVYYQVNFVHFCFPVWKNISINFSGNILWNVVTDSGFPWALVYIFRLSLCTSILFNCLMVRYAKVLSFCWTMKDILMLLNVIPSSCSSSLGVLYPRSVWIHRLYLYESLLYWGWFGDFGLWPELRDHDLGIRFALFDKQLPIV